MLSLKVLDHGYVNLVDSWGSDEGIIEAARMSTNKGFKGWGPFHSKDCKEHDGLKKEHNFDCCEDAPGDEKLLKYLWDHHHMTPFEMAGLQIEVQAPIFVFREWHRHRTQSYNEMSARYTPLPDLNYLPSIDRLMMVNNKNKQASSTGMELKCTDAGIMLDWYQQFYKASQQLYEDALKVGVPKELARLCLPVARYSRMRAQANLRNWLQFLTLRQSEDAQWEIRQYANVVAQFVKACFPKTHELFNAGIKT